VSQTTRSGEAVESGTICQAFASTLPFDETVELMAVIIAGIRSREQGGAVIRITDVLTEL
jgi:hypothetical protein